MEDYKMLTTVLSIVLSVLGLIMAVFGIFMTRVFINLSDSIKTLNANVSRLSTSISGMNVIQEASGIAITTIQNKCDDRRKIIWGKLEEHGEKLADHDVEIEKIKGKIT
jgi:hypothetical protein